MKLKDALVKDGFLKAGEAGRGRPSKAMVERAKELVAQGWTIDGFSATPAKVADKPAEVKHTATTNGGKEIADIGDPLHPLGTFEAVVIKDGKKVPIPAGPKAVCNNCHCSLPWCPCPSPVVNLDYNLTGVVEFRLIHN